jgi:fluoride exporter
MGTEAVVLRAGDAALVGLGGAMGSIARWAIGVWLASRLGPNFPYGTLAVNVTGSFAAGLLLGFGDARGLATPARLALVTGFLGGYTTFSAFAVETLRLAEQQGAGVAALNVMASLAVGLAAAALGLAAGRAY